MKTGKIKKIIKKYWRGIIVAVLAMLFFVGTSYYNYVAHYGAFMKWGSPDENANYIFSKLYAETGDFKIFEKYNHYANDIIHPRSFRADDGFLKPVSFLGIILIYGKIASFTTYKIIPYLTPFFASIGIVFFYLLLKKFFHRNNALISTCVLVVFPPFVYYTARSMFHNVLFLVMLLIGLYFSALMIDKTKKYQGFVFAGLGGLFFGLALITRTSELIWMGPMLLLLWFFNFKKISLLKLLLWLAFLMAALLPAMYHNKILYGSYFFGGYTEMNESLVKISSASSELVSAAAKGNISYFKKFFNVIEDNIFYFGFHPRLSLRMFYSYFAKMFFWVFWPGILGLIFLLSKAKKVKKRHWMYLAIYTLVSGILTFYYGSWVFHDNPDPSRATIGNSYTRYWLPVYLGLLPFVSLTIIKFTNWVAELFTEKSKRKSHLVSASLRTIIILGVFALSLRFVLAGSEEGLVFSALRQAAAKQELVDVLAITEPESVIITEYHDKLLFPERKVIVGRFEKNELVENYAKLVTHLPVYYYNFTFPERDINYLNNRRLPEFGLRIEEIEPVTSAFTLYQLKKIESE